MTIVAKVANLILIVFCLYYANNVGYLMKTEIKVSELRERESYVCGGFIICEISVAIFVAAVLSGGNRVLKTGVI
jgi:hypothetical protein